MRRVFGIQAKVLIFLASCMTVTFGSYTVYEAFHAANERQSLFEGRSRLFVAAQADAMIAAVWNVDDAVVKQQLESLVRDPNFRGARVVDQENKPLAKFGQLDDPQALALTADIVREKEVIGRLEIHYDTSALNQALRDGVIRQTIFGGLLFWVVLGIVYLGLRMILVPLERMRQTMTELAAGRLEVTVPALDRRDEVGEMARAIEVFKANAVRMAWLGRVQQARDKVKDRVALAMAAAIHAFHGKVAAALAAAGGAVDNLEHTSQTLTASAEQTSSQAASVSSAAGAALGNVQTVAAATEELTASVGEIDRQVQQSSTIASHAVTDAERANAMVAGLTDAAEKIGAVIKLINSIAAKTNLLALNATIEAARAGDAGKGFAVVANEVKTLANQTAQATDEIARQVQAVQHATGEAVTVIGGIGQVIREINDIAGSIAASVQQQGAAVQDIAHNAQHAATGAMDVTRHIGEVTQAADHNRQAAGDVHNASTAVAEHLASLKGEIDRFLAMVREGGAAS